MKKIILLTLLTSIFITNCTVSGTSKDENIPKKIKFQIHKLNSEIINGFAENNPERIFAICSDELLKKPKRNLINLVDRAKNDISQENFVILNEFYLNTSKNAETKVLTGMTDDHDYTIRFKALNSEMFVSVGYFKNSVRQPSITLIYGKYGDEWKLNIMQLGAYKIMNKDAFDWYLDAKSNYKKGYLIDAANNLAISYKLMKPFQNWQYQKEKEIQEFKEKVISEINSNFSFPMTVEYVETKPKIFRIFPQIVKEGCYPMIFYKTSIDFNDTENLSKECDLIHNKIGELYKGLSKNKKMIFYKAFKSIPKKNEQVENYGFVKKYD